ncbi:MAG: Spx/MgsR family RNA polymerase-binding regulatory protein [Bdellovibrionales bacterium]|nr:Spx/MgsR family RNA polymerase-binding regulatory protein [Bdellovibrionales bacterium]
MANITVYEYSGCSTCKKALRFLESNKMKFERIAIVDSPPSIAELKTMLELIKADGGNIKNLFNTSGVQYRELQISDKIKDGLTEADAMKLLAQNGKLIKRPFLLIDQNGEKSGTVGYDEKRWSSLLLSR